MLGIHDLMVHDYGPGSKLVSFHIELSADSDVMKSHDLIDSIERDFQVHDHLLVTIHFDPVVTDDPHINELRKFLKEQLAEIAPEADIHDLRIVPGPTHTNVILIVPFPQTGWPPRTTAPTKSRLLCAKRYRTAGRTISA